METVRSQDGTAIAFETAGHGPALVLVNGALSERQSGTGLAALLAPRCTVVMYDRRGRGASGDTAPYAVQREVEDLAAVIGAAGGRAYVYGHSSGALLSLEAAGQGLPIEKLAVYEPPLVVETSRPEPATDFPGQLRALLAAGRPGDAVAQFLTQGVGVPAAMVDQMRASPRWPAMEAMAHTVVYDTLIAGSARQGGPATLARWSAIRVPTLVLDGGASPAWMGQAAQTIVDHVPGALRRTLPGQIHAVNPAVLAPALEAFLAA